MKKLRWYAGLTLIGLFAGFGAGCGKKSGVDPAVIDAASKLPGAADVSTAIDKKDYDGAVAALVKVQQSLTSEEQNVQFRVLAWEALQKMTGPAVTNAQAADAVNAVRALTTGVR
jgi:hypothetical protein